MIWHQGRAMQSQRHRQPGLGSFRSTQKGWWASLQLQRVVREQELRALLRGEASSLLTSQLFPLETTK